MGTLCSLEKALKIEVQHSMKGRFLGQIRKEPLLENSEPETPCFTELTPAARGKSNCSSLESTSSGEMNLLRGLCVTLPSSLLGHRAPTLQGREAPLGTAGLCGEGRSHFVDCWKGCSVGGRGAAS